MPYTTTVKADGPSNAERVVLTVWVTHNRLPDDLKHISELTEFFQSKPTAFIAKDVFHIPLNMAVAYDDRRNPRFNPKHIASVTSTTKDKLLSAFPPGLVGLSLTGMLKEIPSKDKAKGRYQANFQYSRSILKSWRPFRKNGYVPEILLYTFPIISPIIELDEHGASLVVPLLSDLMSTANKTGPCVYMTIKHLELLSAKAESR